jgi:transcriptional regulator with XRE-family HTH domain
VNAIEKLIVALRKRLPKSECELIRPRDPKGRWTLEVEHDGWLAVVVWIPQRGFGITVGPMDEDAGYGDSPEQAYPGDADDLVDDVVKLLKDKVRSSPPRSVALKEIRARYGFTQAELAERLAIEQGTVSKLERSERLDVTRLSEVVKAMGGELEVWVRFPDDAPVKLLPPPTLPSRTRTKRPKKTTAVPATAGRGPLRRRGAR